MNRALVFLLFPMLMLQNCNEAQSSFSAKKNSSTKLNSEFVRDSAATIDTLDVVFYFPENGYSSLTSTRPLKTDDNVLFCCAAAFTLLDNGAIDGLFIENGKTVVSNVNHSLGGGLIISPKQSSTNCTILGTDMGNLLNATFVDSLKKTSSYFFQQIQLVRDGQALVFRKDVSKFQRRAICIFHGKTVIIETKWPCTLQKFANIIKKCGIMNALYVDMGSWDEGWFRDKNNNLHTIGLMRNSTRKQSNWFVFRAISK